MKSLQYLGRKKEGTNSSYKNETGFFTANNYGCEKKRNIPVEVEIPAELIRKRVFRNNIFINNTNGKGNISPLLQYEDTFVELVVQMSRISHSLSPTQSISLINESIQGTTIQQNLIKWKHKYGIEKKIEGKIGMGY